MQNKIDEQKKVNPALPWIVWGALLGSILVYGAAAFIRISNGGVEPMDPEMLTIFTYILGGISLLVFPITLILRKTMITKQVQKGAFEDLDELRSGVFVPYIISWALSESVVIYGTMLSILSLDMNYYFGFASLSLLYMVIFRPNFAAVKEIYYREYPDRRHS